MSRQLGLLVGKNARQGMTLCVMPSISAAHAFLFVYSLTRLGNLYQQLFTHTDTVTLSQRLLIN